MQYIKKISAIANTIAPCKNFLIYLRLRINAKPRAAIPRSAATAAGSGTVYESTRELSFHASSARAPSSRLLSSKFDSALSASKLIRSPPTSKIVYSPDWVSSLKLRDIFESPISAFSVTIIVPLSLPNTISPFVSTSVFTFTSPVFLNEPPARVRLFANWPVIAEVSISKRPWLTAILLKWFVRLFTTNFCAPTPFLLMLILSSSE